MDRGLERAGWQCAFQCELDDWRRAILTRHWPGVPKWKDVCTFPSDPPVDCGNGNEVERQRGLGEFSNSGSGGGEPKGGGTAYGDAPPAHGGGREAGAGLPLRVDLLCGGFPCQDLSVAGKRAGLAGERSGLFFEFARVVSLLSPRWVLLENVPGLLSSNEGDDAAEVIATLSELGYGVAWTVLDSQHFGVPQRRRRVFIVGHLGAPCPPEILFESEGGGGDTQTGGETGESIAHALRSSPRGVDEHTGTTYVAQPLRANRWGGSDSHGDEGNVVSAQATVRRLTPVEATRLQGLPDEWMHTHDDPPFDDPCPRCPDGKRYSALGDAVTETVLYWIGKQILKYGYDLH